MVEKEPRGRIEWIEWRHGRHWNTWMVREAHAEWRRLPQTVAMMAVGRNKVELIFGVQFVVDMMVGVSFAISLPIAT